MSPAAARAPLVEFDELEAAADQLFDLRAGVEGDSTAKLVELVARAEEVEGEDPAPAQAASMRSDRVSPR